ncbi:uncharacterized protein EAE98_000670 [Botrytis deweyae]|uniref:Uncharacterized protein n=1 Tax=Botrytis deweyae TaxID=2478750 RepID=A0ABQ7J3E0_9HELO|nr:uncharacterized protein EAE98_000670 [Botrytis deweyae]KAF7940543.1 hypothetical protein EAE98_000670 [Botrytis deweyae]
MTNLTPELAEALYQFGFLDIDSRDHEGRLPILAQTKFETYEAFDLPRWLITEGVDLIGTLDKENMITTLHEEETKKPPENIDLMDMEFPQTVPLDLLDVDVIDSFVEFKTGNPDHLCGNREVLDYVPWVTWWGEAMSITLFDNVLFYKLGLTHMCNCSQRICPPANSFTKDEVYNIMEEEQGMIEQLESLTAEFEKNFAKSGKPLHAFLKDDWKSRMEEIMSESTLNEEYVKGVREIGVIMR